MDQVPQRDPIVLSYKGSKPTPTTSTSFLCISLVPSVNFHCYQLCQTRTVPRGALMVLVIETTQWPFSWALARKRIFFLPLRVTLPIKVLSDRCLSDPLIGHGRHFGRTVHALCNVRALLTNGILRLGEQADEPEEAFTAEYVYHIKLFRLFVTLPPQK